MNTTGHHSFSAITNNDETGVSRPCSGQPHSVPWSRVNRRDSRRRSNPSPQRRSPARSSSSFVIRNYYDVFSVTSTTDGDDDEDEEVAEDSMLNSIEFVPEEVSVLSAVEQPLVGMNVVVAEATRKDIPGSAYAQLCELRKTVDEHDRQINDLERRITEQERRFDDHDRRINENSRNIDELRRQVNAWQRRQPIDVVNLRKRVTALEGDKEILKDEIVMLQVALGRQIVELSEENDKLRTERAELQKRVDDYDESSKLKR